VNPARPSHPIPRPPRVVYTDVDGTLTGPGASLFAGRDGVTVRAAQAVAELHRAGIDLVPVSGRTASQLTETARLLGARDFIAELGGVTGYDHGAELVRAFDPGSGDPPFEAIARSGAGALLLEAFDLRPHAPWAFAGRECTMLLRGQVDTEEALRFLARSGHADLDLQDNGEIEGGDHVYHLLPRGIGKAPAIAAHLSRRRFGPERAVLVGDSPSDVAAAGSVAAVFLVANGAWAAGDAPANVVVTDAAFGDGFAEAVLRLLDA
jgi:phosphoglycolate phosphatase